jgi:stage II sporulation protein D
LAADEFSGADKLRAIYSAEFRFTKDGLPVVPVAIAEGLSSVTITSVAGGLRLLPEGDGGAEIRADDTWQIRASATSAAVLRYWAVVWRGPVAQGQEADAQMARGRNAGENARRFEQGTLFGVGGEVLDRREAIVGIGPASTPEEAERALERLSAKSPLVHPGVFTELVDRPHGYLEAVGGKSGFKVRNEGVLWFVPTGDAPLRVEASGERGKEKFKIAGSYAGRVYVTIDRLGTMAVVNAVPENKLLAGLIPAEIFPSAPEEALKAQAVAARGELLSKIGTRHIGDPFTGFVRRPIARSIPARATKPRAPPRRSKRRAARCFSKREAELADPVYSANCGGHTENNENAWPDMPALPSLRGHRDAAKRRRIPMRGRDRRERGRLHRQSAAGLLWPVQARRRRSLSLDRHAHQGRAGQALAKYRLGPSSPSRSWSAGFPGAHACV